MNLDGKNKLHEAVQLGDIKLVESILNEESHLPGVNINSLKRGDWTPLMLACAKGHYQIAEILIKRGASVTMRNKDGWTSLHIACRQGCIDTVLLLLKECPQLCSLRSRNGRSCFHIVALHGYSEILRYLLTIWPAGVDCVDRCGTGPLMDAIRSGNIECAEILISHGADIHAIDGLGRTLVHIAAQSNSQSALVFLHSLKLSFDARSPVDGSTPMMLAAREGHMNVIELLVTNYGCDLATRDTHMRTALDHATIANQRKVMEFLKGCASEGIT